MKIAVLGMGKMGAGMAINLLGQGHDVAVWNRSAARAQAVAGRGARLASTPADAAAGADAVISIVADDAASSAVWLGETGALSAMAPGALALECSTVSHAQVGVLAKAMAAASVRYVDSPVNGGPPVAEAGGLIMLVGAAPGDFAAAREVLGALGSSTLHFGKVGTGTAFKLINNLLGAVHIASLAEAVALGGKLGLDPETLISAVDTGPCASPHVKRLVRLMVEGALPPTAGLLIGLREKDARYCLNMAEGQDMALSVGEVAHGWYALANGALGAEDDAALVRTVAGNRGRLPGAG